MRVLLNAKHKIIEIIYLSIGFINQLRKHLVLVYCILLPMKQNEEIQFLFVEYNFMSFYTELTGVPNKKETKLSSGTDARAFKVKTS